MSEPLTSHEIEDVLSSIRRLVSEDLRPARAAMAAAQAAKAAPPAEADKLMLTPALRVVPEVQVTPDPVAPNGVLADGEPGPEPAAPQDQASDDSFLTQAQPADMTELHDADLPQDAGFAAGLAESAPDLSAAFPPPPSSEVYDDAGLEEEAAAQGVPNPEDVLWAAPGEAEQVDAPLADDLVTAPASQTQVHGHWTAQDVPGVTWAEDESDWVEPTPLPFVAHPRKPDLTADPLARAWADRAEEAVRAELGETLSARARTVPPPAQPEPQPEAAAGPGLFDGDEAELDEEMLREIVRDIIREELAGTLGERITRNVRKLVRVEINRALAAREFD